MSDTDTHAVRPSFLTVHATLPRVRIAGLPLTPETVLEVGEIGSLWPVMFGLSADYLNFTTMAGIADAHGYDFHHSIFEEDGDEPHEFHGWEPEPPASDDPARPWLLCARGYADDGGERYAAWIRQRHPRASPEMARRTGLWPHVKNLTQVALRNRARATEIDRATLVCALLELLDLGLIQLTAAPIPAASVAALDPSHAARLARLLGILRRLKWTTCEPGEMTPATSDEGTRSALTELAHLMLQNALDEVSAAPPAPAATGPATQGTGDAADERPTLPEIVGSVGIDDHAAHLYVPIECIPEAHATWLHDALEGLRDAGLIRSRSGEWRDCDGALILTDPDGGIVGAATFDALKDDVLWVRFVVVPESARRQGHWKRMYRVLRHSVAPRLGCREVSLQTLVDNVAMRSAAEAVDMAVTWVEYSDAAGEWEG